MHWYARLGQLGMKQLPQILKMRPQKLLLCLGQQEVGHHLEVRNQLSCAVHREVYVLLAGLEQGQEVFEDLFDSVESVLRLSYGLPQLPWRCPGRSERLPEVKSGDKRDEKEGGRVADLDKMKDK